MKKADSRYTSVKPYGNIGDRKNDGYIKEEGTYFQVYAPEDISKERTIYDAVSKLREDFKGLLKHWDDLCKIRSFYFVVNDKYKGLDTRINEELLALSKEFPDIDFIQFLATEVEQIFLSLSKSDMMDVIGIIPSTEKLIMQIEMGPLQRAVRYVIENYKIANLTATLNAPEFNMKISFNNLSSPVSNLLNTGSLHMAALDEFFKHDQEFTRDTLQKVFMSYYAESKKIIGDDLDDAPDIRFFYMLRKCIPSGAEYVQNAVLVLMSYFFESCDIFEEPKC